MQPLSARTLILARPIFRRLPFRPTAPQSRRHLFVSKNLNEETKHDNKPTWEGRGTEDHAVKRSEHDVQAQASGSGMRAHESGEEGSGATSRKDEAKSNKKAEEEHPEAPKPVIGMNSERGSKGHQ